MSEAIARSVNYARSAPLLGAFLVVALVAFWPTYLSLGYAGSSGYTHLHAITAALWMVLLIVQPLAIARRRLPVHRLLGRLSYLLAPLVIVTVVLLANERIRRVSPEGPVIQAYVLYLQISLAVLFALSYLLAIATRKKTPLHARFMICTAFTLVDPVFIRLMFQLDPTPTWNYQWATFGLTDAGLVALIWLERHGRTGRAVFPAMLAVFIALQLPALLGWTAGSVWRSFASWFAALPLT